jgi:hypothetical protein
MDELKRTFRDPVISDGEKKKAEVPSGHLAVKRKGIFVLRWPLRGLTARGTRAFFTALTL